MKANSTQTAILNKAIKLVNDAAAAQQDRFEYLSKEGTWKRLRSSRDMEANLKIRLLKTMNEYEGFRRASPSQLKDSILKVGRALKMASKGLRSYRSGLRAAGQELTTAEVQHIEGALPPAYQPLADLLEQLEALLGGDHLVDLGEDLFGGESQQTIEWVVDRIALGCDEAVQKLPKHQGRSIPLTGEGRSPQEHLVRALWWTWYENAGVPDLRSGSTFENWITAALELLPNRGMRVPSLESLKTKTRANGPSPLKKIHAECLMHLQDMAKHEYALITGELGTEGKPLEGAAIQEQSGSFPGINLLSRRTRLQELHRILCAAPTRSPGRPKKL